MKIPVGRIDFGASRPLSELRPPSSFERTEALTPTVYGIWLESSLKWLMRPFDGTVITYDLRAEAMAHLHNHKSELRTGVVRRIGENGLPVEENE